MADLSPAAQAVRDAYDMAVVDTLIFGSADRRIAAVLRAAADQVIPLTKTPWGSTLVPVLSAQESRKRLLAIAAELEGTNLSESD